MVKQASLLHISAPRSVFVSTFRALLLLTVLCLSCLASGCADDSHIRELRHQIAERQDAIRAEARLIELQRATVSSLSRKVEAINAERAPKVQQLAVLRNESPTISACILNQAEVKGALVAIFGESEAERQRAGFVAALCFMARMHTDYDVVARQIDVILPRLAALSQELVEPLSKLQDAEATLNQIAAAPSAPRLEQEIETLRVNLACEQSFSCRVNRLFGGKES